MAKLYTRQGDQGQTQVGRQKLAKSALLLAAIGNIDELVAFLGWAKVADPPARQQIEAIQKDLQTISSLLAGYPVKFPGEKKVAQLEKWIDQVWGPQQLDHFVIPGANEAEARWQIARTICRRAERSLVRLRRQQAVPEPLLAYLNRLSDFLFALAVASGTKSLEFRT